MAGGKFGPSEGADFVRDGLSVGRDEVRGGIREGRDFVKAGIKAGGAEVKTGISEDVPSFKVEVAKGAKTIGEALDMLPLEGVPKGRARLDWVLANSDAARQALGGAKLNDKFHYYFPEAAVGEGEKTVVPFAYLSAAVGVKGAESGVGFLASQDNMRLHPYNPETDRIVR